MRKLKINRSDFELAFEQGSHEMAFYLDSKTDSVLLIQGDARRRLDSLISEKGSLEAALAAVQTQIDPPEWQREQILDVAQVEWDDEERYLPIPQQDSSEGYRDMEAFVETVENGQLRELLEVALDGQGAFRRFKDVLYRYPDTRAAWFKFRDERVQRRMLDWLASEGIEPEFE
jgi:hypothetical protein